jgi:hypothetical protein
MEVGHNSCAKHYFRPDEEPMDGAERVAEGNNGKMGPKINPIFGWELMKK